MSDKLSLHKKMIEIMGSVHTIKKSGFNTHHKYQYMTEADILEGIREKLVEHNIVIYSSVEDINKDGDITTVRMKHTFVCGDTGESFTVYSAGQGHDKQDKGIYKAITGAIKYMFSKNLLIAGEDDPENDGANPSYVRNKEATVKTRKTFSRPEEVESKEEKKEVKAEVEAEEALANKVYRKRGTSATKVSDVKTTTTRRSFSRPNNKEFIGHAGEEPNY